MKPGAYPLRDAGRRMRLACPDCRKTWIEKRRLGFVCCYCDAEFAEPILVEMRQAPWSAEDDALLRDLWPKLANECAYRFPKRSPAAVRSRALKLRLRFNGARVYAKPKGKKGKKSKGSGVIAPLSWGHQLARANLGGFPVKIMRWPEKTA